MIIKIEDNGQTDFIDLDKALGLSVSSDEILIRFPNCEYFLKPWNNQYHIVMDYFNKLHEDYGPDKECQRLKLNEQICPNGLEF